MKYIYGLDLSMSNTGVTVYDLELGEVVFITSITTKDMKNLTDEFTFGARLERIYEKLALIKEEYPPEIVVIERGFTRFNHSTQVIFRVHGVVNLLFSECPQHYYTPQAVKKAIYDGTASKEEVREVIEKRLLLEFENEDESDSCAVVLTYLIDNKIIEWKSVRKLTKKTITARSRKKAREANEKLKKEQKKETK